VVPSTYGSAAFSEIDGAYKPGAGYTTCGGLPALVAQQLGVTLDQRKQGMGGYGLTGVRNAAIRNRCWVHAGHSPGNSAVTSAPPGTAPKPGDIYILCSGSGHELGCCTIQREAESDPFPARLGAQVEHIGIIVDPGCGPLWVTADAGQGSSIQYAAYVTATMTTSPASSPASSTARASPCAACAAGWTWTATPSATGSARRRSDTPQPAPNPMDRGAPVRPRGIRRQSLRLLCPQPADAVAAQRSMPRRTRPAAAWTPAAYDRAALPGEPPLHRSLQQPLTLRGVAAAIEDTRPACQMGSSACRGCAAPLGNGRASSGLAP